MIRAGKERLVVNRALVMGFLLAALMAASPVLTAKPAHAKDFLVTNTITTGANVEGSLEEAIEDANENPGPDAIKFNIAEGEESVKTISPFSGLPDITDPVTIDGYSQPGARPNSRQSGATNAVILIEISGANVGSAAGLNIRASNVVVRGLAINRFSLQEGISISERATGARIEGNFIGTDATGTFDRGNAAGVQISVSAGGGHAIGGTSPEARNLISGNNSVAVNVGGSGGNSKVQGNLIGTAKDGSSPLFNTAEGVKISSSNNQIGGPEPGAANTITNSSREGVLVSFDGALGTDPVGNRILNNSIFSNGGLGINLNGDLDPADGRTDNDARDIDTGANNLQNSPLVASAEKASGGKTTIKGTLDSAPSTLTKGKKKKKKKKRKPIFIPQVYTIQFFSNPQNEDEGKTFLGETQVTTDLSGKASFAFENAHPLSSGEKITATATDSLGNTSEFSDPKSVTLAPGLG